MRSKQGFKPAHGCLGGLACLLTTLVLGEEGLTAYRSRRCVVVTVLLSCFPHSCIYKHVELHVNIVMG